MSAFARFGFWSLAVAVLLLLALTFVFPDKSAEIGLQLERRVAGLELRQTEIPGFDIAYLEGGPANADTLVLLHGFSANKDNFVRAAKYLTPKYHVIIPDLPGFGASSAPADADYSLAAQSQRISQILDALQLPRVHLGGNSMGGYLAAYFGAQHPQRIASLWLLNPAGFESDALSPVRQAYHDTDEVPLLIRTPEDYDRVLALVFHEPPYIPGFVKGHLAREAAARHDHYARIFKQIYGAQALEPLVPQMTMPALMVWGADDRVLSPVGAEIFRKLKPDATVIVMPDIGHLPMLEAPKQTAQDYLAFLQAHGAKAAGKAQSP